MKKILSFLLMICLFHNPTYAGQATTDLTLQVEGRAPVVKNDVAGAREEAVKNALEKAIMRAAAKVLLVKIEDEKFQVVKSNMVGKADRYIKHYRIISENIQHDEYVAHVNVEMDLAFVKDDLLQMGILQDQGENEIGSVSLLLRGMKKYSDFVRLKTFLQNHPKVVKSLYPCHLEWQQARFDVVMVGSVQDLVAEFEKSGRYLLEDIKKNQNVVEIRLHVKEEAR